MEDPRSNPDTLEYKASNLLWPTKQTALSDKEQDILQELRGVNFAPILTDVERKVIHYFVNVGMSTHDIKNATGLSRQRVEAVLKSAGEKIKQEYKLED